MRLSWSVQLSKSTPIEDTAEPEVPEVSETDSQESYSALGEMAQNAGFVPPYGKNGVLV